MKTAANFGILQFGHFESKNNIGKGVKYFLTDLYETWYGDN